MAEQATERRKRKLLRSPSYPGIDLKTAIDRASIVKKEEGRNTAPADVIISHWGYALKSGPGLTTLAALKKFGLLEDEGTRGNQQLRLSELAWRILLDEEGSETWLTCVREAALKPVIHRKLWDEYGAELPSDQNLRRKLLFEEKFSERAVDEFIDQFKRTILFAKLAEADILSGHEEDKKPLNEERIMPPVPERTASEGAPSPRASTPKGGNLDPGVGTISFPLSPTKWIKVELPYQLNEAEWKRIIETLDVFKPGFMKEAREPNEGDE